MRHQSHRLHPRDSSLNNELPARAAASKYVLYGFITFMYSFIKINYFSILGFMNKNVFWMNTAQFGDIL